MKGKHFLFASLIAIMGTKICLGGFVVTNDIDDPETGLKTVAVISDSDAKGYIIRWDAAHKEFYYQKVKSNKPKDKEEASPVNKEVFKGKKS